MIPDRPPNDTLAPMLEEMAAYEETAPLAAAPPAAAPKFKSLLCPQCGESAPLNTVVCVKCGTNLKTGRRLLTKERAGMHDEAVEIFRWVWWVSFILPLAITPYKSTVGEERSSTANKVLVALTSVISIAVILAFLGGNEEAVLRYALSAGDRFEATQLVTHIFLHAGPPHLIGNMIFLLVFGAAINGAVGGLAYTFIYLGLGVLAGLAGFVLPGMSDTSASLVVGASGAISGLAGMYLVLFPRHDIHMVVWFRIFWFFRPLLKTFAVTGIYAVLFFTAFDILALALRWQGDVAHGMHVAGFASGFILGLILLLTGAVRSKGYDLLTWVLGDRWRTHLR